MHNPHRLMHSARSFSFRRLAAAAAGVAALSSLGLAQTREVTINVNYAQNNGTSQHIASGMLHAIGATLPAQYIIDGVRVKAVRGTGRKYDPTNPLPPLFDPNIQNRLIEAGSPTLMLGSYYPAVAEDYWPGVNGDNFWFFGDLRGSNYDIAGRRSSLPQ